MALVLIALMGLILFGFFLAALARVQGTLLGVVLQWTSLTILAAAFVLFVVSGRIAFAAVQALICLLMIWRHRVTVPPKRLRLPPP